MLLTKNGISGIVFLLLTTLLIISTLFLYRVEMRTAFTTRPISQADLANLRTEILKDVNRDIAIKLKLNGISKGWEWKQ